MHDDGPRLGGGDGFHLLFQHVDIGHRVAVDRQDDVAIRKVGEGRPSAFAHGLYEKFGFRVPKWHDAYMDIVDPEIYLRTSSAVG